jgi:antitoxin ParD1/3/4
MRIITINLPEKYLDAIQVLNDLGLYPSRSEAIRCALGDFLKEDIDFFLDLDVDNFEGLIDTEVSNFEKGDNN